jgi:hypothetical protein
LQAKIQELEAKNDSLTKQVAVEVAEKNSLHKTIGIRSILLQGLTTKWCIVELLQQSKKELMDAANDHRSTVNKFQQQISQLQVQKEKTGSRCFHFFYT